VLFISANEDRLWSQGVSVAQPNTALLADSKDRSRKVLSAPHATGHAVHDDLNDSRLHRNRLETKFNLKWACLADAISSQIFLPKPVSE
jgi:hypothetical protein